VDFFVKVVSESALTCGGAGL